MGLLIQAARGPENSGNIHKGCSLVRDLHNLRQKSNNNESACSGLRIAYMVGMGCNRPAPRLVRAVLAVVFGFMSLFHGPIMALAKSDLGATHHAMSAADHAGHHHHQPDSDPPPDRAMPSAIPACSGIGCFVALESLATGAPTRNPRLFGMVSPGNADALTTTYLEPAVPPPRLQG